MKNRSVLSIMCLLLVFVLAAGGCSASKTEEDREAETTGNGNISGEKASGGENVIKVGPDELYTSMQSAWDAASSGSVIEVDGRVPYTDYDAVLLLSGKDNITIRGVNGRPKMEVDPGAENLTGGKGIWVLNANNITIENIEFTGASNLVSKNGSGIRIEPILNPTIRNCSFHHNDDGILAAAQPESIITIEGCEFGYNGFGDGYSHNLYIGEVKELIFKFNYSHHVKDGHLLKTRALSGKIEYNRLTDEDVDNGYSSGAAIDMPQGGNYTIIGNVMHQGNENNRRFVWYGLEDKVNPGKNIYFVNNTLVNDMTVMNDAGFLNLRVDPEIKAVLINNIFTGKGEIVMGKDGKSLAGKYTDKNNLKNKDPGFVSKSKYNYHLKKSADLAIDQGTDPGETDEGYALKPSREYRHTCEFVNRRLKGSAIDLGAYEYQ